MPTKQFNGFVRGRIPENRNQRLSAAYGSMIFDAECLVKLHTKLDEDWQSNRRASLRT